MKAFQGFNRFAEKEKGPDTLDARVTGFFEGDPSFVHVQNLKTGLSTVLHISKMPRVTAGEAIRFSHSGYINFTDGATTMRVRSGTAESIPLSAEKEKPPKPKRNEQKEIRREGPPTTRAEDEAWFAESEQLMREPIEEEQTEEQATMEGIPIEDLTPKEIRERFKNIADTITQKRP